MYSDREKRNAAIPESVRASQMLKRAMKTNEIAQAAQDGDFDASMEIIEGMIATCMMCCHPGQELGTFAGGAVWMAQMLHAALAEFDGHIEYGVEKETMFPLLGPAQLAMLQAAYETWKREATINYESNEGHQDGVDTACDMARQILKKHNEVVENDKSRKDSEVS